MNGSRTIIIRVVGSQVMRERAGDAERSEIQQLDRVLQCTQHQRLRILLNSQMKEKEQNEKSDAA